VILGDEGCLAFPIQPSACMVKRDGRLDDLFIDPVRRLLGETPEELPLQPASRGLGIQRGGADPEVESISPPMSPLRLIGRLRLAHLGLRDLGGMRYALQFDGAFTRRSGHARRHGSGVGCSAQLVR
jgi:hypothetical protein